MAINFPSRARIESLKKLADGGEATIYEYDPKTVIKLFNSKVDLSKKAQKVRYFISVKNKFPANVICPQEEVTIKGKFVGYTMRKLPDAEDIHMLVKPKFLAKEHLSNKDVLQIITSLGVDLNRIHSTGHIVGDISDYNFQMNGKSPYFIDVDSWGCNQRFEPDAYTELFTCPDSYKADGSIRFSQEDEHYNFAVLAFNMLTRVHPFGGTYKPDSSLSILKRMKMKLSIMGKHRGEIKLPSVFQDWKWISPQLEKDFLDIFENGSKKDITPDLQDLLTNLQYCQTHDIYYYSKYSECPFCNGKAKIKTPPVVIKVTQTTSGPKISIIFAGADCAYVLSDVHYLNQQDGVVHFSTGRKFKIAKGQRVEFSDDGKIVYVVTDSTIEIFNESNQCTSVIERMYKSNYLVRDRELYYIDNGENLVKLSITNAGNLPIYIGKVYNPIFEATKDGKILVVSTYPQLALITTPDYTFEVKYSGHIREYAIKYDKRTNKWLFVYQLKNGKYRTMVFSKNKIEYDDEVIVYNAQTLSNIDFHNNTIYDPDDGRIMGINLVKNTAKEFHCAVVDQNSRLQFTGCGFKIYNQRNIYTYG